MVDNEKYIGKKKKHNLESFLESTSTSNKKEKKENNNNNNLISNSSSNNIIPEEKETINPYTKKPFSKNYYNLLKKRKTLPAWEAKKNILKLFNENQIIIIQGETGSGKTTQIPQFLLQDGFNRGIAVTQPRRVAAQSVAKRVSEEMDVVLGEEVGYSVRFDDKSSKKTLIKYLTDGMLLREATMDKNLMRYCTIIIDEAHERTLATDILFGFLKELLPKRKDDLKLIIMSATIDIHKFQEYFNAPLILIPGRMFPVEIKYLKEPADDYFEASINYVVNIHKNEKEGDILLFLTGEEEIENAVQRIREEIYDLDKKYHNVNVIPMYGTLPPHLQQKIFEPFNGRKIIVATNIAESSITVDGVVYVVDPGFAKQKVFNPRLREETLMINEISQESAEQRAGRAGRTRPGKCYRLYTEESFKKDLNPSTIPEILRSNITSVVLNLKNLGIDDLVHFDFIDPPAPETMMRALEMLNYLGAIDDDGNLTELGKQMNSLPLEPEISRMVLGGIKHKCINETLTIAALLSNQNPFMRPRGKEALADEKKDNFSHHLGDHITYIKAFYLYKQNGMSRDWCNENFLNYRVMKTADSVREQLKNILLRQGIYLKEDDFDIKFSIKKLNRIVKSLIEGFFAQVAHLETSGYYTIIKENNYVLLHPSSVLHDRRPKWIIYNEFVLTNKNYIRMCTEIQDPKMLLRIAPDYYNLDKFGGYAYKRELERCKREIEEEENELE